MPETSESSEEKARRLTSVLSISHDKDVDGIASAAIVWRRADSKGMDFSCVLTDYGAFEPVFSGLSSRRNTLIIVTDLGMDETVLDIVTTGLARAIDQGCKLVWLDHHNWSKKSIDAIRGLGNDPVLRVNHDYCAAEITQKVLMAHDRMSQELARIAHDTDFNLREIDAATALTDAVSVIRFRAIDRKEDVTEALYPLLKQLAKEGIAGVYDTKVGRFRDSLIQQQVDHYRKEKAKKMRKALAGHCDQEIHGRLVRVVEIPSGLTSTDMGTFAADPENLVVDGERVPLADLLLMLSPGGMLGIRRGSERVLCNTAAKLFNGGGHAYAAGGEYGLYEDFQAVCDDIFMTLSKSTDWVVTG
jgi:oligoribonuclease NrnB/cAMP/cGMP phosphodiesterase (DHH superfamily)